MSYILSRFGTVALPTMDVTKTTGTDGSVSGIVALPNGQQYDALGSAQALGVPDPIVMQAIIDGATAAALQSTFDALRAYRGQRQTLYAAMGDGSTRWRRARCQAVKCERKPGQAAWLNVEITFLPDPGGWNGLHHGAGWVFDSGLYFDAGLVFDEPTGDVFTLAAGSGNPNSLSVVNSGNAAVRNAILTITAGATPISAVHLTQSIGVDWLYTGTIAANKSLVVNCGVPSVKNDGADAWATFVLNPTTHTIAEWLRLDPDPVAPAGVNTVVVTLSGGGATSTATWTYSDNWE